MAEAPSASSLARSSLLPGLALCFNALVWGVSWLPFRELNALGVHPLWATAIVFGVAVLLACIWHPQAWRGLFTYPWLWVLMAASGLSNFSFNWAMTIGDVVRVALLFYTMPAWSVLLAWWLLGERPTRQTWAQLVLALTGVLVVMKSPESPWPIPESLADYLALLGGFAFALTNSVMRKVPGAHPASRVLAMFAGGATASLVVAVITWQQGMVPAMPAPDWPWIAWLSGLTVAFVAGNLAFQFGATRLGVMTASLIMLSELLFAAVSSAWWGASTLTLRTLAGGSLIVLAAVLASKKQASPPVTEANKDFL